MAYPRHSTLAGFFKRTMIADPAERPFRVNLAALTWKERPAIDGEVTGAGSVTARIELLTAPRVMAQMLVTLEGEVDLRREDRGVQELAREAAELLGVPVEATGLVLKRRGESEKWISRIAPLRISADAGSRA